MNDRIPFTEIATAPASPQPRRTDSGIHTRSFTGLYRNLRIGFAGNCLTLYIRRNFGNKTTIMKSNRGIIQLIFGAACISFSPILVKLIGVSLMTPTAIGFWRCILGALILFSWAILTKRQLLIEMPIMRWAILAGFFFSFDLFFWHRSIIYAGAGLSTILGNTQVFASAILGFFIFKDRLTIKFFLAAVAAMAGVVLLAGIGSAIEFTDLYTRGIFYGLMTGLSISLCSRHCCFGCYRR